MRWHDLVEVHVREWLVGIEDAREAQGPLSSQLDFTAHRWAPQLALRRRDEGIDRVHEAVDASERLAFTDAGVLCEQAPANPRYAAR